MTTWFITGTKKSPLTKAIERYRCQKLAGKTLSAGEWMTRHDVARAILAGDVYWTAKQVQGGGWQARAKVEIHITTEPNASVSDNLENLPSVG